MKQNIQNITESIEKIKLYSQTNGKEHLFFKELNTLFSLLEILLVRFSNNNKLILNINELYIGMKNQDYLMIRDIVTMDLYQTIIEIKSEVSHVDL